MQSNEQMLDLCRTAMNLAADMTGAFVADAERICGLHARVVRDACLGQAEAAKQFKEAASAQDLFAIQGMLAQAQMEKAMSYWTDLCATGSQNTMELLGRAQAKAFEIGGSAAD